MEEYFSFYPGVILNTKIIIFCGMRCFYIFSFGGVFPDSLFVSIGVMHDGKIYDL